MFYVRWAEALLRAYDYRIDPPGTPDPRDPAVAAKLLRATPGWDVYAPGISPPVPPLVPADAEAALKALGCTIFWPEEAPEPGLWSPEDQQHPGRYVTQTVAGTVFYESLGAQHQCRVKTFHQWRRHMKATYREALA